MRKRLNCFGSPSIQDSSTTTGAPNDGGTSITREYDRDGVVHLLVDWALDGVT